MLLLLLHHLHGSHIFLAPQKASHDSQEEARKSSAASEELAHSLASVSDITGGPLMKTPTHDQGNNIDGRAGPAQALDAEYDADAAQLQEEKYDPTADRLTAVHYLLRAAQTPSKSSPLPAPEWPHPGEEALGAIRRLKQNGEDVPVTRTGFALDKQILNEFLKPEFTSTSGQAMDMILTDAPSTSPPTEEEAPSQDAEREGEDMEMEGDEVPDPEPSPFLKFIVKEKAEEKSGTGAFNLGSGAHGDWNSFQGAAVGTSSSAAISSALASHTVVREATSTWTLFSVGRALGQATALFVNAGSPKAYITIPKNKFTGAHGGIMVSDDQPFAMLAGLAKVRSTSRATGFCSGYIYITRVGTHAFCPVFLAGLHGCFSGKYFAAMVNVKIEGNQACLPDAVTASLVTVDSLNSAGDLGATLIPLSPTEEERAYSAILDLLGGNVKLDGKNFLEIKQPFGVTTVAGSATTLPFGAAVPTGGRKAKKVRTDPPSILPARDLQQRSGQGAEARTGGGGASGRGSRRSSARRQSQGQPQAANRSSARLSRVSSLIAPVSGPAPAAAPAAAPAVPPAPPAPMIYSRQQPPPPLAATERHECNVASQMPMNVYSHEQMMQIFQTQAASQGMAFNMGMSLVRTMATANLAAARSGAPPAPVATPANQGRRTSHVSPEQAKMDELNDIAQKQTKKAQEAQAAAQADPNDEAKQNTATMRAHIADKARANARDFADSFQ